MNFDSRISRTGSMQQNAAVDVSVSTPTEVTRNEIECLVASLENRVEDMSGILDPVLRPEVEKKGDAQGASPATTKQHARLGALHVRLSLINEKLGDLIQRIEV